MRTKHIILWRTFGVIFAWLALYFIINWVASSIVASEGARSLVVLMGLISTAAAATITVIVGLSWLPG